MHPTTLTHEAFCLDLVYMYQKHIPPQLLSKNPKNGFAMVGENNHFSNNMKQSTRYSTNYSMRHALKSSKIYCNPKLQFVNIVTSWCNTQWWHV